LKNTENVHFFGKWSGQNVRILIFGSKTLISDVNFLSKVSLWPIQNIWINIPRIESSTYSKKSFSPQKISAFRDLESLGFSNERFRKHEPPDHRRSKINMENGLKSHFSNL